MDICAALLGGLLGILGFALAAILISAIAGISVSFYMGVPGLFAVDLKTSKMK